MLQIQTESPTPQGIVLAFHFRPTGPVDGSAYSIVSLRSGTTAKVLLSVGYTPSTQRINFSVWNATGNLVAFSNTAGTAQKGKNI